MTSQISRNLKSQRSIESISCVNSRGNDEVRHCSVALLRCFSDAFSRLGPRRCRGNVGIGLGFPP